MSDEPKYEPSEEDKAVAVQNAKAFIIAGFAMSGMDISEASRTSVERFLENIVDDEHDVEVMVETYLTTYNFNFRWINDPRRVLIDNGKD